MYGEIVMSMTQDFVIEVAVGIEGFALLSIKESLSPHSVYCGSDAAPDRIMIDIKECGMQEWAEAYLNDTPVDPGVYTFRGSARFDEDEADYSMTCDQI